MHLDVFEPIAAAGRAATVARVEAECTRGVFTLLRRRLGGKYRANDVERTYIARRVRACRATDRALVDHDDVIDQFGAPQAIELSGCLRGLAAVLEQSGVQNILYEGGLAGARDARDADQTLQRQADINVLEVVLARALEFQPPVGDRLRNHLVRFGGVGQCLPRTPATECRHFVGGSDDGLAAAQVLARQRLGIAPNFLGAAEEDDLATALTCARPHVKNAIRFQHDLRIVFHHHQRVACVAQTLHDADDPLHVARMQADRRFVQDE